jgi:hypothetical protein
MDRDLERKGDRGPETGKETEQDVEMAELSRP